MKSDSLLGKIFAGIVVTVIGGLILFMLRDVVLSPTLLNNQDENKEEQQYYDFLIAEADNEIRNEPSDFETALKLYRKAQEIAEEYAWSGKKAKQGIKKCERALFKKEKTLADLKKPDDESAYWKSIIKINTVKAYEKYLSVYPNGEYRNEALKRIKALKAIPDAIAEKPAGIASTRTPKKPTSQPSKKKEKYKTHGKANGMQAIFFEGEGFTYKKLKTGKILPGRYIRADAFKKEGYAHVFIADDKEGIIDKEGNVLLPVEYNYISKRSDHFSIKKGKKVGILDLSYHWLLKPEKYEHFKILSTDLDLIKVGSEQNGKIKWGLYSVREKGEVISLKYDEIINARWHFNNNREYQVNFEFALDGKWGVIRDTDEVVFPAQYDYIRRTSFYCENYTYAVIKEHGLYGLINNKDEYLLACKYKEIKKRYDKERGYLITVKDDYDKEVTYNLNSCDKIVLDKEADEN